jgi:hypothetical protein
MLPFEPLVVLRESAAARSNPNPSEIALFFW